MRVRCSIGTDDVQRAESATQRNAAGGDCMQESRVSRGGDRQKQDVSCCSKGMVIKVVLPVIQDCQFVSTAAASDVCRFELEIEMGVYALWASCHWI